LDPGLRRDDATVVSLNYANLDKKRGSPGSQPHRVDRQPPA